MVHRIHNHQHNVNEKLSYINESEASNIVQNYRHFEPLLVLLELAAIRCIAVAICWMHKKRKRVWEMDRASVTCFILAFSFDNTAQATQNIESISYIRLTLALSYLFVFVTWRERYSGGSVQNNQH